MSKNFWQYQGKNKHARWEYNLETTEGEYARKIAISAGTLSSLRKEPINDHVDKDAKPYSIEYVIKYMGLTESEFLQSLKGEIKFSQEELLEKFFIMWDVHSEKVKSKN